MYNGSQRTIIAKELARAGMKFPAALDALHRNYDTFRNLCESTVRRMSKDPFFNDLVQHQEDFVHAAREATAEELEEARLRQEALCDNPIRQSLVDAVCQLQELARTNPNPKTYKVLLEYLEVLRSLELPESKAPIPKRNLPENLAIWSEGVLIKRRRAWFEKTKREMGVVSDEE